MFLPYSKMIASCNWYVWSVNVLPMLIHPARQQPISSKAEVCLPPFFPLRFSVLISVNTLTCVQGSLVISLTCVTYWSGNKLSPCWVIVQCGSLSWYVVTVLFVNMLMRVPVDHVLLVPAWSLYFDLLLSGAALASSLLYPYVSNRNMKLMDMDMVSKLGDVC